MNERLLEFVKQAGISTTDHGRGPFIDDHVSLGELAKFAELIVQECGRVLEDNELGGYRVDHVLREHFSVDKD